MRIDFKDTAAKTGNVTSQKAFTVEMNAMAFHTLIDGIYQDKFAAPIRELSTNAFDAHIAAGCRERPFVIRLPSYLDRTFSVRDYGVSLSHDEIMTTYTTMFASTKRDTNEQVGMIGLGSKSPFAYTSSFSVIAYLNGTKRTYSCYMDGGVPTIALMDTSPTDEENGLEVAFPVRSGDEMSFREAAKRVIFGFDVKPTVLNESWKYEEPKLLHRGSNWRMFARYDSNAGFRGPQIRQGTVVYPLDVDKVPGAISLKDRNIVFDVPIGSVTVTTSREELGYDDRTKTFIKKLLEDFRDELLKHVETKVAAEKTYLDACLKYGQLLQEEPYSITSQHHSITRMKYKGQELKTTFTLPRTEAPAFCHVSSSDKVIRFREQHYIEFGVAARDVMRTLFVYYDPTLYRAAERMRLLIADQKKNGIVSFLWFRTTDPKPIIDKFPSGVQFFDLSTQDYAKKPRLSRKSQIRARRITSMAEKAAEWFDPTEVEYYCLTKNRSVIFGDNEYHESTFQWMLNKMASAGVYKPGTWIAVTSAPHPDWKCLHTELKKEFDKLFDPAAKINETATGRLFGNSIDDAVLKLKDGPADLLTFIQAAKTIKAKYDKNDAKANSLASISEYFLPSDYKWPTAAKEIEDLSDTYAILKAKYPLLSLILTYGNRLASGNTSTLLNHYMDILK